MNITLAFLKKSNNVERPNSAFTTLITLSLIALFFLLMFSLHRGGNNPPIHGFSIFAAIALIAFASFGLGAVIGFLFGIPRTLQHSARPNENEYEKHGSIDASERFLPNTNLEQISDWLTKIIIGVGLIQMNKILHKFSELTTSLGKSIAPNYIPAAQTTIFVAAVMIFFTIVGFLVTYLWTRLFLARIQGETTHEKIMDADLKNKRATSLVNHQLNLPEGVADISEEELIDAFASATPNTINSLFFRTVNARQWPGPDQKKRIARTIPIFKALIKLDRDLEYPENFAELGKAYMEKADPDYKEAVNNLTKAINGYIKLKKIEGGIEGRRELFYKRALCRILSDLDFTNNQPSTPENSALIRSDIEEAKKEEHAKSLLSKDPVIGTWLEKQTQVTAMINISNGH